MRIISGKAKGIRLEAGDQDAVRPTTDRVKESLFNIIGDIKGCVIVDFFAGSGALGLEALSRGAAEFYFVEKDAKTCRIIEKNLKKVQKSMGGDCGKAQIISAGYRQAIQRLARVQPNMILADPPYADNCKMAYEFLEDEDLADWAGAECMLILEHTSTCVLPEEPCWEQFRRKDYGLTAFTFWDGLEVE